jgi:hypothetical protein
MFSRLKSFLHTANSKWPFDQVPNVAAMTTRQVIEDRLPVLRVAHYAEDDSWAFTCGTTSETEDIRIIAMGEAVEIDQTLKEIASLPPGWGASRSVIGGTWSKYELPTA